MRICEFAFRRSRCWKRAEPVAATAVDPPSPPYHPPPPAPAAACATAFDAAYTPSAVAWRRCALLWCHTFTVSHARAHLPSSCPSVGLGGKKKKKEAANAEQISVQIAKLKGTIELLDQKEKLVNKKIKTLKNQARIKAKGIGQRVDKAGALNLLKQVKMQEKQVARNSGMQLNLHQQIATLENALVNVDVLKAQMESTQMLKGITAAAHIEDVDDMMLDMEDTLAAQDAMADALSAPMGGTDYGDDDDLMAEFLDEDAELFGDDTAGATAAAVAPVSAEALAPALPAASVPVAPTATPVVSASDKDEMDELAAMMM